MLLCLNGILIGANISTVSQVIGYPISNFILHCNGSETNPDDCLMVENQGSDISHNCQGTIIRCFITDPDPQLCNISLPTTLPEYKTMVSGHTTVETLITKRSHKNSSTITITSTVAVVIVMVAMLTCLASYIIACFIVRQRKKAYKTEKSKQEERKSQKWMILASMQ